MEKAATDADAQAARAPKEAPRAARFMSAHPALVLLTYAAMKQAKPWSVAKATLELGGVESLILPLGFALLAGVILCLIWKTLLRRSRQGSRRHDQFAVGK